MKTLLTLCCLLFSVALSAQTVILPDTDTTARVHFPSAFTPNGDGKNDVFFADTLNVRIAKLTVSNRWGSLVYETTSGNPWDGKLKGKPCEGGVYYYTYSYYWRGDEQEGTGFVTLIR